MDEERDELQEEAESEDDALPETDDDGNIVEPDDDDDLDKHGFTTEQDEGDTF